MLHKAGPMIGGVQRCERCGAVLKRHREDGGDFLREGPAYPEGAVVESHATWQAMYLGPDAPDCQEATGGIK